MWCSSRDQHLATATGNTIYAENLDGEVGARYSIVRVGEELRDPDNKDVIGCQGTLTATAKVTRTGDPATLQITDSKMETYDGDLLFPKWWTCSCSSSARAAEQRWMGASWSWSRPPRWPASSQGVVINRGSQHGLEPGHVLAVYQVGPTVRDANVGGEHGPHDAQPRVKKVKLPDERAATLMVFKTFERVSYALDPDLAKCRSASWIAWAIPDPERLNWHADQAHTAPRRTASYR